MSNLVSLYKSRSIRYSDIPIGTQLKIVKLLAKPEWLNGQLNQIVTVICKRDCKLSGQCPGCNCEKKIMEIQAPDEEKGLNCNYELITLDGRKIYYE
jgi:hypothetical protein